MLAFLKSKKVKALIGTIAIDLVILLAGPEWGQTAITVFSALGGTYIVGQSFADGVSKGETSSTE